MSTKVGRPRSFDRSTALEQAMLLFWERGYDAVSIRDLTAAMGITPPSLYAAFTDKRALFEEAVEHYAHRYGSYIQEALEAEPTSYRAVRRLLTQSAIQQTLPGHPAGCLILHGAANQIASESVATGLRARRANTANLIEQVTTADIESGELPPGTDAHALSTFAVTIWQGLDQLARDGRSLTDLKNAVDIAMSAWPCRTPLNSQQLHES